MRKIRISVHSTLVQDKRWTKRNWENKRVYASIGKKYDDGAYIFREKHNDATWQWWQCDSCEVRGLFIKSYSGPAIDGGLIHNIQAHGWKNTSKMRERMSKRIFFEGGYRYEYKGLERG